MRPARDGDVGHAVVEQVFGRKLGVDVDQDAIPGLAPAEVAGDGVAVVQMRMLAGIDADGAVLAVKLP